MNAPLLEAHCHLPLLGRSLSALSLEGCRDSAECLARVKDACTPAAPSWLVAMFARVESWADRRWPPLAELDAVTDRPACLWSFDLHAAFANSAALRAAGIAAHNPDPAGGVIERDHAGRPTGLLLEAAAALVRAAIPEPTIAERLEHVAVACRSLAAMGFAEAHDLLSPPWLGPALAHLHDQGRLPIRVGLYAPFAELPAHAAASANGWARPGLALRGGKVFADGTLNSRTAWMLHPYADPHPGHPRGTTLMDAASISAALAACRGLGLGLAAHAIGDAAVRACLDAAENVGPLPVPFRVEHAEIIDADDVPRFARLGVVASLQPCHLLADIEVLERALPHRLHRVLPIRELLDSGLAPGRGVVFGSDAPVVRADPADSVRAATDRRRVDMPSSRAIAPDQAIGEPEAWACFAAPRG